MYDIDGWSGGSGASTSTLDIFPTSSAREEPFTQSSNTTRYDPLGCLKPSPPAYKFLPEYAHYLAPAWHSVAPGLTSLGQLTPSHPIVSRLLSRLSAISSAEGRREPNEKWYSRTQRDWTVNDVLDLTDDEGNEVILTELQAECVFVLAALKVLHHPTHPKHFTLWGREWAPKTAERVHKMLQMSPCPIASWASWISVDQSLWLLEVQQSSAFPAKKEGKKTSNGMLLRKRKAGAAAHVTFDPLAGMVVEGVTTGERPRKRVRTSTRDRKGAAAVRAQTQPAEDALLEELTLPGVTVSLEPSSSGSSTAVSPAETTKETKLELMGIDAPPPSSVISAPPPPPEPTRRSTRQARKRTATASPAITLEKLDGSTSTLTPASEISSLSATPPSVIGAALEPERPVVLTRARSSSSSCGSTATAVSNAESVETVVAEDTQAEKSKMDVDAVVEEEKPENVKSAARQRVRASGRVRKPAAKKVEAQAAVEALQEALVAEKTTGTGGAKKARVRSRSRR